MELNGRLKAIADEVLPCETLFDVGTDHAYIPIYLTLKRVCREAVAADVRRGPLIRAEENIRSRGLADKITVRLGAGLEPLDVGERDAVVIAGMGGKLITKILSDGYTKARNASGLILQPMTAPEALREWLYLNGFDIYSEKLVSDGGKLYCVISARWTGEKAQKETIFYFIGEKLLKKNDPLVTIYMEALKRKLRISIGGLEKSAAGEMELKAKLKLAERLEALMTEYKKKVF